MVYDLFIQYKTEIPTPKGKPEWIVENGRKCMMSFAQTREFYDFMFDNELMSVFSRKGKADMGYCRYISKYKSPMFLQT